MKKRFTKNLYPVLLVALVVGLGMNACKTKPKQKPVAEQEIKKEVEEYVYPLISAFDVPEMLNSIEASYIVGITNDVENVDKYLTEQSKAVNLGVYIADLAYVTTYNQKPDIQSYFDVIKTLVSDLDMAAAISQSQAEEIENNLDNKEKLVELITQLSQDAYSYLNRQGRTELSYLVLAGTAIEGLYLTTHISENTFQNPKIIEVILYQKEPLLKLQKMMEPYKASALTAPVYDIVRDINEVYALEESTTAMTKEQVEKLTALLNKVREESVQ